MPPSLSIVFPMHNEQAYVGRAVAAAGDALVAAGTEDYEILVVDDASTDRTGEIAGELARRDTRVRLLRNERKRGLGGALRVGFAAATKDLVLYSDADLPVDLGELPRAIRVLEQQRADILAGYRFHRTAEGWRRAVYASVYNALIRLLFGLRVRDVNFAFKLIRRSLLERIDLRSEGSFIDAELLLRARKVGAVVVQMGLDYFPRTEGVSKLSSPAVIAGILREMLRSWRELR